MDIFLLPMAGSNMIIGIQGLKTLGPVTFDFVGMQMKFQASESEILWLGCPWIKEDPLTKGQLKCLVASTQEAYLCYIDKIEENQESPSLNSGNAEITEIIQEYTDIFESPMELPPQRERDHYIHLEPNSKPVNVRPYRYLQFQKSEIEKLISEMLKQQIIKPSTSPYY